MNTRDATLVRIHVPVAAETLVAMLNGIGAAAERDPVLAPILAVIREDNPLGDFGLYKGVFELSPGWEGFQPGPDAQPTLGEAGCMTLSPTVIVSVHAPCPPEDPAFAAALERIMAIHPWEVPVMEISSVRLAVR
ncbi:hypothetical protein WBP06_15575 [Novosphingobium sp. BL-8H]|uniref:hypothetical protein n=1 Tax=Novosphingobium sp. BL-8H TaxID=3127640 RepID=UPI00375727B7